MKTLPGLAILVMTALGCHGHHGDGREPYTKCILWEKARVENESGTPAYRCLSIKPGTNYVIEVREGYYRSKTTTAHSTHDAVYMVLPRPPGDGEELTFTSANHTLDYGGFWGYGFSDIDTTRPAVATISVWSNAPNRQLAYYQVALWNYSSDPGTAKRPASRLFVMKGSTQVEHMNAMLPPKTCPTKPH